MSSSISQSRDPTKADRAETLIAAGGMICVQVLTEFTHVARRKLRFTWSEVHSFLSIIRELLTVQPMTIETQELGLSLAERYELSIWDAMIIAAALGADCDTLWSEDRQHGMAVGVGLRIRNPFRDVD